MRRNGRFSSSESEGGSTLLEVIAAMAIISILGIGAWNAVSASLRIAGRIHDNAIASERLLVLDDRVRGLAGRIRAPFWAARQAVEADAGSMSVSFLDGNPEKKMSLSFQGGILSVDDGSAVTRFTGFTEADFSPATDDGNNVFGITVNVRTKDGKRLAITARFGSMPIGRPAGP
jgi:hypothetical protein